MKLKTIRDAAAAAIKLSFPKPLVRTLQLCFSQGYREQLRLRKMIEVAGSISPQLWQLTKGALASGPFKGMQYLRSASGSAWAPKILGTYEMELVEAVEALIRSSPPAVVVLGAAEGYYAVGMAVKIPSAKVYAFESSPDGRLLLDHLTKANKVESRLSTAGHCSVEDLRTLAKSIPPASIIICDVEGGELELLDPGLIPELRDFHILAELHPWASPALEETVTQRLGGSSGILRKIYARPRSHSDFPKLDNCQFTLDEKLALLHEHRPPNMTWLWKSPPGYDR